MRSSTSVGANYRAACKARSKAEFIAKMGVAEEEADEACYWLEVIVDAKLMPTKRVNLLRKEAEELLAILAASRITAKRNK